MHAAVLHEFDATPRHEEFPDPEPADGHVVVEVAAAAIHHLDLHKATGTFYMGPPPLPSVVGSDGVGRLPDGRRVYFEAVAPHGSMAERGLARADTLFDVHEGLDDPTAAALANSGLGAWLALSWRAGLQPGETVLVLGATGQVGRIAVQAAKRLGAGRVVAAARGGDALERARELGADQLVALDGEGDLTERIREAAGGGVDVTIDSLWGEPAVAAMGAAGRFARHVQVGHLAGPQLGLAAPAIRSASLDVRGFMHLHASLEVRREAFRRLGEHVARGDIVVDLETYPLADVGTAWERQRDASGGIKRVLLT